MLNASPEFSMVLLCLVSPICNALLCFLYPPLYTPPLCLKLPFLYFPTSLYPNTPTIPLFTAPLPFNYILPCSTPPSPHFRFFCTIYGSPLATNTSPHLSTT